MYGCIYTYITPVYSQKGYGQSTRNAKLDTNFADGIEICYVCTISEMIWIKDKQVDLSERKKSLV